MRPIHLSLQAIGPFKGKVEIDFDAIGANELFLIHGKTGTGKTTLFDAICYALYGSVPSGREGTLKSDFATELDMSFVRFVFALQDDHYVAYRQFAHQVPLKTDITRTKGSPDLYKFARLEKDGTEKVLASKKSEMTAAVQARLGLDVNQFAQVVLLPQGEFRQLLLASSRDREGLMEKLFDSSLYDGVQGWFDEETRRFENENRLAMEKRNTFLTQAWDLISEDRRPAADAVIGIETLEEEIGILRAGSEAGVASVRTLVEASEAGFKTLEEARVLARDLENLARKHLERETIQEQQQAITLCKVELSQAREAAALVPEQDELDRRKNALAELTRKLADNEKECEIAGKRLQAAEVQSERIPALQASKAQLLAIDEQAKALCRLLKALDEIQAQQDTASRALVKAEEQRATCEKNVAALASRLEAERGTRDNLQASESDLEQLRGRLEKQQLALAAIQKIQQQSQALEALNQARAAVESRTAAGAETLAALVARWNRNAAGVLAQGLQAGVACPVCGSPEHPRPAKMADETATQAAVDAAEASLRALEAESGKAAVAVEKAAAILEVETNNLRMLEQALGGMVSGKDVACTKGQIDAETKRQADLRKILETIHDLEVAQIPKANEKLAGSKAGIEATLKDVNRLSAQVEDHKDQIARHRQPPVADRLQGADLSVDVVEALLLSLKKESVALGRQMETINSELGEAKVVLAGAKSANSQIKSSLLETEAEYRQLSQSIAAKLAASPFGDTAGLRKAVRTAGWIATAEKTIKDHENRSASLSSVIEELTKRIGDREAPDVDSLEHIYTDQKQKADEATAALHSLQHTEASLSKLANEIRKLDNQFEQVEKKMKVLGRLEKQIGGKGQPKISLKRFFLAQRLEEVLIQASNRLRVLSDGRFDLRRDPNVVDGRAGAGLDLLVSDGFTGTDRPVNSLSGGQMFLASLSMALGLADVVQARSGGIRLDTLFIDEGFGSLDDETLQIALKVLNELRAGRMVGVISHVNELKRQVEKRIEVIAADDAGSAIRMYV